MYFERPRQTDNSLLLVSRKRMWFERGGFGKIQPDKKREDLIAYQLVFQEFIAQAYPLAPKKKRELKNIQKILNLTEDEARAIEVETLKQSMSSIQQKKCLEKAELKKQAKILLLSLSFFLAIAATTALLNNSDRLLRSFHLAKNFLLTGNYPHDLPTFKENPVLSKLLSESAIAVNAMAIAPDGDKIVLGGNDRRIVVGDLIGKKIIATLENNSDARINSVAISSDKESIASADSLGVVKIWHLNRNRPLVREFIGHSPTSLMAVTISSDARTIVSGDIEGTIKVWHSDKDEEIDTLRGHSASINSLAISPDGSTLLSVSNDKTIGIWNLKTGRALKRLKDTKPVFSVAIASDGRQFITGNEGGILKIWNLAAGEELGSYQSHTEKIGALAIADREQIFISGSNDKTIGIWNLFSKNNKKLADNHNSYVNSVAIGADGKTLVSASKEEIKVWQNLD